jgi:hypothetical protein
LQERETFNRGLPRLWIRLLLSSTAPYHKVRLDTPNMPTDMDRSRSRSPYRSTESPRKRKRSRSPHRYHSTHKSKAPSAPVTLPLGALPLTRHDLKTYRPMFALYLDIQKQKYIEDLSEDEVKGRWKSFIGKWYAYLLTRFPHIPASTGCVLTS